MDWDEEEEDQYWFEYTQMMEHNKDYMTEYDPNHLLSFKLKKPISEANVFSMHFNEVKKVEELEDDPEDDVFIPG